MNTTIAVVGNAPVVGDHTALVDGASVVYRFNQMDNYGRGTGRRLDYWVLASHPIVLARMASRHERSGRDAAPSLRLLAHSALEIVFAIPCRFTPLSSGAQAKETASRWLAARRFLLAIDAADMPSSMRRYPRSVLAPLDPGRFPPTCPFPSNGYLTIAHLVQTTDLSMHRIVAMGFNWQGWAGHPWEAEEEALRRFAAHGQIVLVE